ncbi:MAG: NAD-dependent epimerase/dehydratase family protein [Spirochaetia bacterium]
MGSIGSERKTSSGAHGEPGLQVVFGTGPVGCAAAELLLEKGLPVRMVNRTGKRPAGSFLDLGPGLKPALEFVSADAMKKDSVISAAQGATHIYHCVNVQYQDWEKKLPIMHANIVRAATESGAVLAAAENLYMYARGLDIIDDTARVDPPSRKGRLIQRLHESLVEAGVRDRLRWTVVRASDFYGPGSTEQSLFGTVRFLDPLFAGKRPLLWGNIDLAHTFTYVGDYGRALATAGLSPEAYGSAWIVPNDRTVTTRAIAELFFRAAGFTNSHMPRVQRIPRAGFAFVGLFNPLIHEVLEVLYQKEEPYVVDGGRFRKTFGFEPTPLEEGVRRTLEWYQATRKTAGASMRRPGQGSAVGGQERGEEALSSAGGEGLL